MNSLHVTTRVPLEIFSMICSNLIAEEDIFSASQVCHHWRGALIASPSLWTHLPCRDVTRTILSLERCKYLPVRLGFYRQSLDVALEEVLLHGNKITTLTIHQPLDRIPSLHRLLMFSRPFVERLHIRCEKKTGWGPNDQNPHEIWQDLPSLRELFVCQYTIPVAQLSAPNLAHLALQEPAHGRVRVTIESILGMLRGCPLLETLLISCSNIDQWPTGDHPPVSLPRLRAIEFGVDEVRSGLITHLHLSPGVAVGFRDLSKAEVCGNIPPAALATMQYVLGRFDIHCVTLAVFSSARGDHDLLIRFEGLRASLEITAVVATLTELRNVLFGQTGVLFSHSPRIRNVRELHIAGYSFLDDQDLSHIGTALPNLVSISFFRCKDPHMFLLLTHTSRRSPPFPRLERIMALCPKLGLRRVVKKRRDCGVPLKTLVVGREPNEIGNGRLEDYAALGEFVDDLRIGCPVEISDWGAENEVLNIWSNIGIPRPVSPNRSLPFTVLTLFRSPFLLGYVNTLNFVGSSFPDV